MSTIVAPGVYPIEIQVPDYQIEFMSEINKLVYPISVWTIDHLADVIAHNSMAGQPDTAPTRAEIASRRVYLLRLSFEIGLIPERFLEDRSAA